MAQSLYANNASTTVAAGKTAVGAGTVEAWAVASSAGFPAPGTLQQFHLTDPDAPTELMAVTAVSGTNWTVIRGAESAAGATIPVSHAAGFTVYQVASAGDLAGLVPAGLGYALARGYAMP